MSIAYVVNNRADVPSDVRILALLADVARPGKDGKTPTELAKSLKTHVSQVSRSISRLQERGMVKRLAASRIRTYGNEEVTARNRYYAIKGEGLVYLYGSLRSH